MLEGFVVLLQQLLDLSNDFHNVPSFLFACFSLRHYNNTGMEKSKILKKWGIRYVFDIAQKGFVRQMGICRVLPCRCEPVRRLVWQPPG